jgi:hypothetical protein
MTNEEIRRRHKEGATVQILADLNAVPSSTIKSILENKPVPATPTRKYQHRNAEYKKLYDEGKGDSEIGELMGTRASNVWSWRKTNKLPSNVAPKRKNVKEVEPISEKAFIFAMENAGISMDVEETPKVVEVVDVPVIMPCLRPRYEWIEERKQEIMQAVKRHADVKCDIPYEWMQEYFELSETK